MKDKTIKMKDYNRSGFLNFLLNSDGAVSVLVVLFGFLIASILVLCVGRNPLGMYESFLQVLTGIFWNNRGDFKWEIRYVGEWLNISVPYILCGLTMGFASRAGLFNIGGEGQYLAGLTTASIIGLYGPQILGIHWILAVILAIVAGAFWGGIVGFLKAKFEVSEVVATIMLNYIALYLARIVLLDVEGASTYKTPNYPLTASLRLEWLDALTNTSKLNISIFFVIIAVVVYWFLIEKTKLGFGLRATGYNKDAALCSGIPVVKSIVLAMAISGAFSGLAGASVALGSFEFGRIPVGLEGYGFAGIAVALVGNLTAGGTLVAGLLFGMLARAQGIMQENGIPKEITLIIQGLIVVFIAFRAGLKMYISYKQKKELEQSLQAEHLHAEEKGDN